MNKIIISVLMAIAMWMGFAIPDIKTIPAKPYVICYCSNPTGNFYLK